MQLQTTSSKREAAVMADASLGRSNRDVTLAAMNLSGRFAGGEIRRFGQAVIANVLIEKDVDLMFGQQANFKPRLPSNYVMLGSHKAFLAHNNLRVKACDDKQFRMKLRDLQFAGKLPFHYLPQHNYTVTKVKTRHTTPVEFIAVSWLTDEGQGRVRNMSWFKKLMNFVVNLSAFEELPVVVGGTFQISLEDASEILPPNFCCYGYVPQNMRRTVRASDFFVCSQSVRLEGVRPVICANLHMEECPDAWLNPEDAFYCDPVRATLINEKQTSDCKIMARRSTSENNLRRDELDGPKAKEGISPAGPLRKLPSCPELYDDIGAENGTTCYMS